MKATWKKKIIVYVGICLSVLWAVGCGGGTTKNDAGSYYYYPAETQETEEITSEFTLERNQESYVIVSIDYVDEVLHVHRYVNDLEYQYYFSLNTDFLDRYGNRTSSVNFVPGSIVYLGTVDSDGKLRSIQMADDVWEYTNVTRFSMDADRGVFKIADSKYVFNQDSYIFSDQDVIKPADITDNDILTVVGRDKQILSIIVTTGHGTLELTNTSLFEDSFLQLNTNIFAIITHNMKMEVPEGTYMLAVANDGWGGNCEIEIKRGETTTVDLDTIKGDGPNHGLILFVVDIEGAKLYIDNQRVDYTEPISLKYGWHTLRVSAEGYDEWNKKLYVNSEEATIEIEPEKTASASQPTGETGNSNADNGGSNESNNNTDNNTNNNANNNSANTDANNVSDQYLKDYMSTLTDLLGSL